MCTVEETGDSRSTKSTREWRSSLVRGIVAGDHFNHVIYLSVCLPATPGRLNDLLMNEILTVNTVTYLVSVMYCTTIPTVLSAPLGLESTYCSHKHLEYGPYSTVAKHPVSMWGKGFCSVSVCVCLSVRTPSFSLTLGAHAQRGLQYLVCVSVCLSVCLSVRLYSRTTGNDAVYERYQQL